MLPAPNAGCVQPTSFEHPNGSRFRRDGQPPTTAGKLAAPVVPGGRPKSIAVSCCPESTLQAFDEHGRVGEPIAADGGDAEATLAQFASAGFDVDALAATLQSDGGRNFVKSWDDLLRRIDNQVGVVA